MRIAVEAVTATVVVLCSIGISIGVARLAMNEVFRVAIDRGRPEQK